MSTLQKKFNIMNSVGHAKYLVNYHNGIDRNSDGSEFWGAVIFKNKKKLRAYIDNLKNNGYKEK